MFTREDLVGAVLGTFFATIFVAGLLILFAYCFYLKPKILKGRINTRQNGQAKEQSNSITSHAVVSEGQESSNNIYPSHPKYCNGVNFTKVDECQDQASKAEDIVEFLKNTSVQVNLSKLQENHQSFMDHQSSNRMTKDTEYNLNTIKNSLKNEVTNKLENNNNSNSDDDLNNISSNNRPVQLDFHSRYDPFFAYLKAHDSFVIKNQQYENTSSHLSHLDQSNSQVSEGENTTSKPISKYNMFDNNKQGNLSISDSTVENLISSVSEFNGQNADNGFSNKDQLENIDDSKIHLINTNIGCEVESNECGLTFYHGNDKYKTDESIGGRQFSNSHNICYNESQDKFSDINKNLHDGQLEHNKAKKNKCEENFNIEINNIDHHENPRILICTEWAEPKMDNVIKENTSKGGVAYYLNIENNN